MAERKAALNRAPARPELKERLERAKTIVLTEEQMQEQRASFAYGNAPRNSRITKASATSATKRIRLSDPQPVT
ncbi:hypothetical protein [Methylobacterium sp. Leaf466]|uniref:hypothetical protein n=1 Tax=Methylobacterium sp. Leaf466 TaxID=1736386 RepID=UPI000A51D2E3|nr:hypothetical protein [Methylobacterium sp. Leaf466]